jgi:hypothetical protein
MTDESWRIARTAGKELVFEAVSGQGAKELVGRRLPARTGIAGSVLMTGEPIVIEDRGGS